MSCFRKVLGLTTAVLLFAASANAAIFRSLEELEQGALYAADPMFDPVGATFVKDGDVRRRSGSAVLIAPDWLLTAAHTIDSTGISEIHFFTGVNLYDGQYEDSAVADAWYTYPGYTSGTRSGAGHDIGLVHLSSPILSVDPAVLYTGVDQRGTLMHMAGYGQPGTASTGPGDFDGLKRAGSNLAEKFGNDPPLVLAQNQYWLAEFTRFNDIQPLEWQSSPGDSGGGWFADIDGQMQLVGINHGILGDYGNGDSVAIRVSLYDDWINETMGAAAVPEPSSFVIFGTGALMFLPGLVRRRQRKLAA